MNIDATVNIVVFENDVASLQRTVEELWAIGYRNLASGLEIDTVEIETERAFMVKHSTDMGASAIGLPDFHANACEWTAAEDLFVGFPDPSLLFVIDLRNKRAVSKVRQGILTSDYWGAVALTQLGWAEIDCVPPHQRVTRITRLSPQRSPVGCSKVWNTVREIRLWCVRLGRMRFFTHDGCELGCSGC